MSGKIDVRADTKSGTVVPTPDQLESTIPLTQILLFINESFNKLPFKIH